MTAEEMLKELYDEVTDGSLPVNNWEEGFINDVYEVVWERDREMTVAQEDKVEEIYDRYFR